MDSDTPFEQTRSVSSVVSLRGRSIQLVPFDRRFVPWLHRWETDLASLYLWSAQREVLSLEDYEHLLLSRFRGFYHVYFVVTDIQGAPQGFVFSYEANLFDGFSFIAQYLEPQARGQGRGVEVFSLFVNFLFTYYGSLRKLYCDVYEYNVETLSMLKRGGLEVEGCFKQHRFYGGRYHDMFRLALYRETFSRTIGPRLEEALRQLDSNLRGGGAASAQTEVIPSPT